MTYNFDVCQSVRTQINAFSITDEDKTVVIRCVGGYSRSKSLNDMAQKTQYKWKQYWASYPDWNKSVSFLKNEHAAIKIENNPTNTIAATWFFAPLALLSSAFDRSGINRLNGFIQENNRA